MKKTIITIVLVVSLFTPNAHSQQPSHEHTNFADIILLLTANTVLNFGLAVAHELGHIALAKLFVSLGAPIIQESSEQRLGYAPNSPHTSLESKKTLEVELYYPEFESRILNGLVILAGPAAGALASYGTLKATNIIIELNKQSSVAQALKKGLKKPAFNEDQPASLKGLAFTHLILNSFALIPFQSNHGTFLSEGEKIRQAFFKNRQ